MANYSNVPNKNLCTGNSGIKKKVINELLPDVVDKFSATAGSISVPLTHAKWEGHVTDNSLVKSLRVDMQGVGTDGYANWQAQFGVGHDNKCARGGSYAGVLMKAGSTFTLAEFQEAFRRSFESQAICRLDP